MKYTPRTDDELENEFLLKPGFYDAEVIEAFDEVSKKGKEMLHIKLDVGGRHIHDYLSAHFFHYKYKHFLKSAGKLALYESGNVNAEDVLRLHVIAQLEVQSQEGYSDKNSVVDYFLSSEVDPKLMNVGMVDAVKVVDKDDDLPF